MRVSSVNGQVVNLSLNLVMVSIYYVFLGGFLSYILSHSFPSFDARWKESPLWQQLLDVAVEISIIVVVSFWVTYLSNAWIPLFPVNRNLEWYVECFGGQVVFLYAVFIFMETLDDKLIHVFKKSPFGMYS